MLPNNKDPRKPSKLERLLDFLEWFRRGVITPITVIRFIFWAFTLLL